LQRTCLCLGAGALTAALRTAQRSGFGSGDAEPWVAPPVGSRSVCGDEGRDGASGLLESSAGARVSVGRRTRVKCLLDDDRRRNVEAGRALDVDNDRVRPWRERISEYDIAVGNGQPVPRCTLRPEDVVRRQVDGKKLRLDLVTGTDWPNAEARSHRVASAP
jgi:hypothetical protein